MLIVEDDDVERYILHRIFDRAGFSVLPAEDAKSALDVLSNDLLDAPSVILTDFRMPGAQGDQLLHDIRKRAALKNVPVVFVTASHDPGLLRRQTGCVVFAKPVDHNKLVSYVTDLVASLDDAVEPKLEPVE